MKVGGPYENSLAFNQMQLLALCSYCLCWFQTKYMQLAKSLWVQIQLQSNIFLISMFNLGMANGAKIGLKLRLRHYKLESIREINLRIFYYIILGNVCQVTSMF